MSHVVANRKKLLARVNRLIGQMNALKGDIETAEHDEDCARILQQIASIRGAIGGLGMLFVEDHLRDHVARGKTVGERVGAAEELLTALKSFGA
ncbi:MAG: metal/formaldehyde-sensitive transcriptional repressor [Myxococcales bacterium]|nr:metal/formaldehyde-sensitive transcriptional repressor [Myxococcales bacterium]